MTSETVPAEYRTEFNAAQGWADFSVGYAWLDHGEFDPSDGIMLHSWGKSLKIASRNLNVEVRPNVRLLAGILRHRVPWIQEADGAAVIEAAKDAVVIEEVKIK